MVSPRASKVGGTWAPALARASFLALAVSRFELAHAPACPNWTSDANMLAHVPMHHATRGLLRTPLFRASHTSYSSTPPTSPSSTSIFTWGSCSYLVRWSMKVVPGYLSPPMATPS
uniref:Putative secreted protein n=1 Tax=Ixodes ricinus TaxID=34613 RepID=A0A6B0UL89_IXORI